MTDHPAKEAPAKEAPAKEAPAKEAPAKEALEIPTCTSCHRPLLPGELSVKFQCPNCAETTVWRCSKCRKFSRSYVCSKCSFEGP